MKKVLSLLCIFAWITSAQAAQEIVDFLQNSHQLGAAPCAGCEQLLDDDDPPPPPQNPVVLKTEPSSRTDTDYFSTRCHAFIDAQGNYGEYGKIVRDYINEKGGATSRFFSNALPGMETDPKTCPKWGRLSNEDKMKFWVWTFAAIAHVESSCDRTKVNNGRVPNANDRPRGLLQINTLKSGRSWRGPNCGFPTLDSNRNYAVLNARNNLRCGLDIMDELLKGQRGEYRSNGKIFPTNSYWEKLRPSSSQNGGKIGVLVRQFKPCH